MKKTHYIVIGTAVLVVLVFLFFRNGEPEYHYTEVERGDLVQEIFETGSTEKGNDVKASFREGGRIENIFKSEGESVNKGDVVAVLDKRDLELSLREARAALSSAEASLERMVTGSTREEVEVAEAAVKSAKNALSSAEDVLEDQKKNTEEALKTAYQSVPTVLGDVFSGVKEVNIGIKDIASTYFTGLVVSETTSGRRSRDVIRRSTEAIERYKDMAMESDITFSEKEEALEKTREELRTIIGEIDNIINIADSDFYEERVSDADKELLRGYRVSVNTVLGEVTSLIGSISLINTAERAKITSARNNVSSAENSLNQAEKELERVRAGAESADVRVREAAVDQAKAKIELLTNRISDATLRSPVSGMVSDVLARSGEVVSAGVPVAVITPEEDIQIAVDIYEGDISKISIGNEVSASFVAFPNRKFMGEVVFINPTGKIMDGVVYYSIKIILDEYPENVLPQMTVDVTIKTEERKDVLMIPERLTYRRDGKTYVMVFEEENYVERGVEVGIRGEGRMVEVVSGLNEGEKIFLDN